MSEKPIIMTGESAKAILEGRKTMTRRAIHPDKYLQCLDPEEDEDIAVLLGCCPYGRAGTRLWIKETWTTHENDKGADCLIYKADVPDPENYGPWRSPMFMPRWASRIALEIVSVRIERLQDIGEQDAIAEGLYPWVSDMGETIYWGFDRAWETDPRKIYARLWDSINAKRGYSWESNPYVWCIEFSRIKP